MIVVGIICLAAIVVAFVISKGRGGYGDSAVQEAVGPTE